MSHVVGAGTVAFSRGEDRPRGVPVVVGGVAAGRALEGTDIQSEAVIGSLTAPGAGHRGVGGRHQHHRAARPHTRLDQLSFAGAERRPTAGPLLVHGFIVWCPKYRREVVDGTVDDRPGEIVREVCAERNAPIGTIETMPDQAHLHVVGHPRYGIHRLVKQIKGRSSRLLRREFPHLRSRTPTLWTNSYLVATTGGTTSERSRGMSRTNATSDRTPIRLDGGSAAPDLLRTGSVSSPRPEPWVSTEDIR